MLHMNVMCLHDSKMTKAHEAGNTLDWGQNAMAESGGGG